MKVLHLLTWYPTDEDPLRGIWIERHVGALDQHVEQEVAHLPSLTGPWRLKEWKAFRWMRAVVAQSDADVINVHIAYPLLVYAHLLPASTRKKIVITEHWSYYRFHFYSSRKLSRVKRIFHRGWPVFAVSQQLIEDIQGFSGADVQGYVVPNVVDVEVFQPGNDRQNRVVMGSFWKHPKTPVRAIEELDLWLKGRPGWRLEIFGYGPQSEAISEALKASACSEQMTWLGPLESPEIASLVAGSKGFVHASAYETFSVVCAEAQCAGTPVAYTPNGALPEVVTAGVALPERDWRVQLDELADKEWPNHEIAREAQQRFGKEQVGKRYFQALQACFPS